MSEDNCINRIIAKSGNTLSKKEAKDIYLSLREIMKEEGVLDPPEKVAKQVSKREADKIQEKAIIDKRNDGLHLLAADKLDKEKGKYKNYKDAIMASLVGINEKVEGGRDSIESRRSALFGQYSKGIFTALKKAGLKEHWLDKRNSRDLGIELANLNSEFPNLNMGKTRNKQALEMAKITKQFMDDLVSRANDAGTWINYRRNFIAPQVHVQDKLLKVGFEKWREFIYPKLNLEKTFRNIYTNKEREERLLEMYHSFAAGDRVVLRGAEDLHESNLLTPKGDPITLIFKEAEDWLDYNEKFGTVNTQGAIMHGMDSLVRNVSVMEVLGPYPEKMLKELREKWSEEAKQAGDYEISNWLKEKGTNDSMGLSLDNLRDELFGYSYISQNHSVALIGAGIRKWINMSSLGASVFTQIPDIVTRAFDMKFHGANLFEHLEKGIEDIFFGLRSNDKKRLANSAGAGFEGWMNATVNRIDSYESTPGAVSSLQNLFFKLNLMTPWNDNQKSGMTLGLMSFLAEHRDLKINELDEKLENVLSLYNIGEKEWELLKLSNAIVDGRNYFVPDELRKISHETIRKMIPEMKEVGTDKINRYLRNFETKYRQYLVDRVEYGILTPGIRERAIATRGTRPGTPEGEFFRFFAQFKMFSLTTMTKSIPREWKGSGTPDIASLASMILMSTAFAYIGMSLKDTVRGKKVRNPGDLKTWGVAFIQGGGAGLYADYLFQDYNRYGHNVITAAAGPWAGRTQDLANIFAGGIRAPFDEKSRENLPEDIFSFAKNNTPFLNLFYAKTALDYLILYDLQERMNPGYLRRMEKRIMETSDQEFYEPPSDVIPYGGR